MSEKDEQGFDEALMARARELPAEVQPQSDLWPGIEAAIRHAEREADQRPRWQWQTFIAQAAAVIVLVGASSALTWLAVKEDRGTVVPRAATTGPPLEARSASFGTRYSLGPGFQEARRDLEGRFERELARLSPQVRAEVEANLATIRDAIGEINEALAAEPDNALLQQMLLRSYREELAVMRKVNGIAHEVMRREDI